MNHILVINSSVTGAASVSRILVEETVQRLKAASPEATVTYRDIGLHPIPHLIPATVSGIRASAQTEDELKTQALSDELISELLKADTIVIGAPMYNFSIHSSLRSWFDHILRAQVTFTYSDTGPKGLITGVRAIVIQTRGGFYSEGPGKVMDFQEPYLQHLLGFIGITDVTFIHAEKLAYGPEARELGLAAAKSKIEEITARLSPA